MSTPKKTAISSNKVTFAILGLLIFVVISVVSTFIYRERISISVSNYFVKSYGVRVEQLTGLEIQFDLQQPLFIEKITLDNLALTIDYLQFEQVTENQTAETDPKTTANVLIIPELPDWIPDLHIHNMTVQAENLPDFSANKLQSWSALKLTTFDVKNIVLRYNDASPQFGFSVWLQDQQLLTAQLNYVSKDVSSADSRNTDNNKILKARLNTDLSKVNAIVSRVLPEFNGLLSGTIKLKLAFDPQHMDRMALSILLNNAGLSALPHKAALHEQQQSLIANTNLTLDTELAFDDKGWLPETIDLNLVDIDPITVSADNCSAFGALFKIDSGVCQSFKQGASPKLAPVTIRPTLPLSLQVTVAERNIENWQVTAQQLATTVLMSENTLALQVNKLRLTPQSWQGGWAVSATSNSRFFSAIDGLAPMPIQVTAKGVMEINLASVPPQTQLLVNQANIAAQQFKYTDMSSDDIALKLLAPTTINIVNNEVLPFNWSFSTTLINNQYQQMYQINTLTAQHQGQFSVNKVVLSSDWQLDDTVLKSNNTLSLSSLEPNKAEGYWLLPTQDIPSVITKIYPLPAGLELAAQMTNQLNYRLNLNAQQPYLTANIVGEITADSGHFNDISAADLNTHWRCKMDAEDADILASLAVKCTINSDVATVNMGPVVHNINVSALVSLADEQLQVVVDNVSGEVFSGTVSVSPLIITDFDHIVGQIQVRHLSLPEAIELYQVPGVKVTGLLKAELPFVLQGSAVSITDGIIEGQGEGGIIQIKDNATIDQLKLTQPQLRYALELLENLHYDRLHSDVDFKPSGETKLTINIKGRNPSVERPIEFNYSHEENILQLFRSLRINDSMYDALDKMNKP
ncbi:MAG: YdbH domain-containing protein [Moritella sp.]|uniref:intermembrane phospholipid transport protein YdbH family protein n=1 Tax=Moritella sp. TaxID=78556 RepID=UPI0029A12148|nr:YdbH domain-containing protein [Moritella sp.]MDX2319024.1 YdbH domain-containing protein [Moritella sp.]